MTSNHRHGSTRHPFSRHGGRRIDRRPDGALLAGVCIAIANRLGWNVWALRVLFVLGLLIKTIAVGIIYLVLAFVLPRLGSIAGNRQPDQAAAEKEEPGLASQELDARQRRIAELERRFREMEQGQSD